MLGISAFPKVASSDLERELKTVLRLTRKFVGTNLFSNVRYAENDIYRESRLAPEHQEKWGFFHRRAIGRVICELQERHKSGLISLRNIDVHFEHRMDGCLKAFIHLVSLWARWGSARLVVP